MENITNSAEEVLIDSLSFKLPSSGNYVVDRRSCTFHTEGSNSYSASQGAKVIRFRLAGDGWLGPSTFRIMFDVVNDEAGKKLRPIGRAHAFVRRLRIAVRGQIVEDIDNFNRASELFHIYNHPPQDSTIQLKVLVIMRILASLTAKRFYQEFRQVKR